MIKVPTDNKPRCLHCGQPLEPNKRGGHGLAPDARDDDKVCRFCRVNYKGKCTPCALDKPHEAAGVRS